MLSMLIVRCEPTRNYTARKAHSNVSQLVEYELWNTEQFQDDHFGRRWNAFGYIVSTVQGQSCAFISSDLELFPRMRVMQLRLFVKD
jgi:hypothetical protein